MREITKITFDFQPNYDEGEGTEVTAKIGERLRGCSPEDRRVEKIEEHKPQGEGDRWFYDITFNDGTTQRTFNPSQVFFAKEDPTNF